MQDWSLADKTAILRSNAKSSRLPFPAVYLSLLPVKLEGWCRLVLNVDFRVFWLKESTMPIIGAEIKTFSSCFCNKLTWKWIMPGGANVHWSQCHPALAALKSSCIDLQCLHMVQLFLPLRAGHALCPFILLQILLHYYAKLQKHCDCFFIILNSWLSSFIFTYSGKSCLAGPGVS